MKLGLEEQELHISAAREDDFAIAYCSDRTWVTKMDKLVSKAPSLFKVISDNGVVKTYKFPKRLISIRSSIVKREMTDEQRKVAAERLKEARDKLHSQQK